MSQHKNGDLLKVNGFEISDEMFEKGMAKGKGPCLCDASCCLGGVYTDITERDRILAHAEMIRKYMDETQPSDVSDWFEDHESEDVDFPSGRCVGTNEFNDKCAFLDKHGRCSVQVAATEEGMHKWALKPLYCVLFPIEITDKRVQFDDLLQGDQQCCTVTENFQTPLFEVCKDELVHLLGEDGFMKLRDHYRRMEEADQRGERDES